MEKKVYNAPMSRVRRLDDDMPICLGSIGGGTDDAVKEQSMEWTDTETMWNNKKNIVW